MIKLNLDIQTQTQLKRLINAKCYEFLGFTLNLDNNTLIDNLNPSTQTLPNEPAVKLITPLLHHYTLSTPAPLTNQLIKFKDLPGGYAYEGTFINRAIKPLEQIFGKTPQLLAKATKLLGGRQLNLGDSSAEISALRGIPLTLILYSSEEFNASANILYDKSAANFLPTEDLAVLGELTTLRLIEANKKLTPDCNIC